MIQVMQSIAEWVSVVGVSGFFDMLLMALLIYTFLVWFKRTRAAFVLKGIFIVIAIYLLVRQLNLVMITSLLEKFFAGFLVVIVIIFQEELRYFFEQVASWSLNREIFGVKRKIMLPESVEVISRTLKDFARERIGALIVIKGKDIIARHLDGGVELNGKISGPLLESLFDAHSNGHDGAVIIVGETITKFSCHLPLSKDFLKLKKTGTRHAAALGLAELTDALCLVVSEEQGTISVMRKGRVQVLTDPAQLPYILERFINEVNPRQQDMFWDGFFNKNSVEKIYAVLLSVVFWFVLVYGSKLTYQNLIVPVTYAFPSGAGRVVAVDPKEIEVVLKGTRGDFYFLKKGRIKVFLNLKPVKGEQIVNIYPHNVVLPKSVVLDSFGPHEVKIHVE
jgi:diadenylate cyclase